MKRILLALCPALALTLAVAGCGGSSNSGSSSATTSTSAPSSTASSTASSGGGTQIKMQNIQFSPKATTVKVGQKVTWVNEDTVDHNVTANSGASFKSKDFGNGATFAFTPTKAGTIKYVCTIHPGMTATLTVTG
jgi:plastocyanin